MRRITAEAVLRGAASGSIATIPMTLVMMLWHRVETDWGEKRALPPTEIVDSATPLSDDAVNEGRAFDGASLLAHFMFGAAAGAVYESTPDALRPRRLSTACSSGVQLCRLAACDQTLSPAME